MTKEQFIEKIAPIIVKYAPKYNILCPSAIIAQAVLESAAGSSELALHAFNYFGLKYRAGRCPTASGIYYKDGAEQNADGSYSNSAMQWMKFPNMEAGVQGYFDFVNISNYKSIKGVSNPKTYLENIKKSGYATSLRYVDNLMAVISKYNLTKYDPKPNTNDIVSKYYRVQCGAFSKKENALALEKKLKQAGFSTCIKTVDGLNKVQLGAFKNKANAEALLDTVKSKGFDAFLTYC